MTITYTVKHIVTRTDDSGEEIAIGHLHHDIDCAHESGERFAFNEREHLGYPPGDERIQFPDRYRTPE